MPLAQDRIEGSVIYADYRMMGDDHDNKEFNAGLGYREMIKDVPVLGDGIVGVHGWFDRRKTQFDSKFNQITVGGEWFSDDFDAKLNAYYPLNKKNDFTRTNPNGSGAGFVGNQLLVNTDQNLREEALRGLDLEFGVRVPFLDDYTDSTRVYAAGFHFEGDDANDVSGWRARFTSDVNSDIQLGARVQHDDVRGSQGFLEATIRFPFGHKQSYKKTRSVGAYG